MASDAGPGQQALLAALVGGMTIIILILQARHDVMYGKRQGRLATEYIQDLPTP